MNTTVPEISVILPIYNERENIPLLWNALAPVMDECCDRWESIWVDDGSTDGSRNEIKALREQDRRVRLICLERNRGQSAAFWCGIQSANGATIITLDADLQNDPTDIPAMLDGLSQADVVIGWRQKRNDPFPKKVASRIANRVRNWITRDDIVDVGCSLKVFRRRVFDEMFPFNGMHRFFPTLAKMAGFRVVVIPVQHHPRRFGRSKYGIWNRTLGPLVDCLAVRWMQRRYIGNIIAEEYEDD